ncbi:TPA: 16S rRNA (cytosine(1402)-N(4))-methyltransferase [Candidatus Saccharibacteria bacterium]|nr:16S rRNA (cytosine(1402)-N(4))-methyltransferase [Candidatus Saccharibacteria bacterium]HRK40999.1 16S rRNA (cytosine(1402)-N(4))-methyltransferase RsmH [Candidatus Saccharibacteria bacterium]
MSKHTPQQLHAPVLLDRVVELLAPQPGETYLDLTAGYAGHASAIADRLGGFQTVTLVDRDENAIAELTQYKQQGATVVHDDFAHFAESATEAGQSYDMVLVDFGVSSPQLDRAERGFSIQRPGPLDMRMDPRQSRTAQSLVNGMSERDFARMLVTYGEERPTQAARIARAVVRSRPLRTTEDLARAVLSTHRGPRAKVHPATRTFQAIRIALNDELSQIERLLGCLTNLVRPGGRVAFISFHSLEDRLVKRFIAEHTAAGYEAEFASLTKKAIRGATDDVHNPRARSATLRAAVKK